MCILFAPRGALSIAVCWRSPSLQYAAISAPGLRRRRGGFCRAACWRCRCAARGGRISPERFCRVARWRPPLLRCCIRLGLRWRWGGFLCGKRPQRSGDVARIRCIPRASVPKPCIRASAPHAPVCRGSENTIDMQGFCPRGPFGAARLLRDAVSFDAVRLRSGLLRKRDAFLRRDRRTSGTASFRCAFQKLASGARFARLPGAPFWSSSRRVSRASGRCRRRFPPLHRLSGQCA